MIDDDQKEINDLDDLETDDLNNDQLPNTAESFDDDIDDEFEEFENDFDAQDHGVKKSGGKGILFLLIILIALGGAGYFFLGKSLPFMGKKTPVTDSSDSHMAAPTIPPVPDTISQADGTTAPLPPPPMPTPIGPDTGMDNTATTNEMADIAPMPMMAPDSVADEDNGAIEDMSADASIDTITADQPEEMLAPEETIEEDIIDAPAFPDIIAETETAPAPVVDNTTPAVDEKAEEEKSDELVTEEELMPATIPASAPSTAETNMRIEALEKTIQALNARLDEISQSTQALETEVTAAPAPIMSTDDKENLDMLSQQMLQITHRLDQMSDKIDRVEKVAPKTATAPKKVAEPISKPAAKAPKTSTSAPAPVTPKKKAPVAQKAVSSTGSWVLRSAQPDVAWLSKSGSSEMQRYSVGQTIPSFGTIQSISQVNGQWVVRTTGGVIKQ